MRNQFVVLLAVVACLFMPVAAQADIGPEVRAAAEAGDAESQLSLGLALLYGTEGMTAAMSRYYPDAVEAMDLLHKSAEQNNPEAQHMLGEIYSQSLPSPALQMAKLDVAKAREWYAKAAALAG